MVAHLSQPHDLLDDFVDGRLGGPQLERVQDYLNANPEAADYVASIKRQNAALQSLGAPVLNEPVPEKLSTIVRRGSVTKTKPTRFGWADSRTWIQAAAAVLLLLVGGTGGWFVHDFAHPQPTQLDLTLQSASFTYGFYGLDDGFPLEFTADRTSELEDWITQRFGRRIDFPDLTADGYEFTGGNIVPGAGFEKVFFLYSRSEGGRISIVAWATNEKPTQKLGLAEFDKIAARYWFSDGLGYAVVGESADSTLEKLSNFVYQFYGEQSSKG
jgi:anti-sigma factor RsiW